MIRLQLFRSPGPVDALQVTQRGMPETGCSGGVEKRYVAVEVMPDWALIDGDPIEVALTDLRVSRGCGFGQRGLAGGHPGDPYPQNGSGPPGTACGRLRVGLHGDGSVGSSKRAAMSTLR